MHRRSDRSLALFGILLLAFDPGAPVRSTADDAGWSSRPLPGARLSAAGERLLREELAAGRLASPGLARRLALDGSLPEPAWPAPIPGEAGRARGPAGGVALLPDVRVNDRAGDATCAACGNRPLGQAETTVASLGSFVLAGWNDTRGFCTGGAVQGYGYSTDEGLTWVDAGDVPPLATGGRYRGDPVHAVNRKSGDFYICGLYQGGAFGSGLALARGRFSGGAFVVEDNRQIAVGGADFLDKEWLAVDSLSGNLYVSYTNFTTAAGSRIELIRSTDNGRTWDPPLVLNRPETNNRVQGSRPAVGPDGEVHVTWYEQDAPRSHMRIRRSDDFGASFGPERTVTDFYENPFSGAPGFRRAFGIALPGIAVDASDGPYRGRVYVAWDESVNFWDAPFDGATAQSEVENNGFFASATPFRVGDVLRGSMFLPSDVDFYRFAGRKGQTVVVRGDSASNGAFLVARLVCGADTSGFGAYRFLAYTQGALPTLVFTLPADGDYYLRLSVGGGDPLSYVLATAFDTPSPGERARDHRDRFVAHSDDGATWSQPVRLNDDDPWFDGVFPEVTVDGTGAVHCFWHDFRDDPGCGAESFEYMTSSGDGGATWGPNRRVSDARSFWSFDACGTPNQGDYQGITSDGTTVRPCWADSRLGDPDVFIEGPSFRHGSACPPESAAAAGSAASLAFRLENRGTVAGDFAWSLEDDLGWLAGAEPGVTGSAHVAAGEAREVVATFAVPAACPDRPDRVRFVTRDRNIPGRADTCEVPLHCVSATAAAAPRARLGLEPPRPNPSAGALRLRFTLSRRGPARLEIFDAGGARIRRLVDGVRAAGAHDVAWDGRDERGRAVGPGVYYVRLEAEGRALGRAAAVAR